MPVAVPIFSANHMPISKLTSWFLLMIISYTMVAWIKGVAALDPVADGAGEEIAPVRPS